MPIYMDRHDVSKEVTAEMVAELHQKDLKIQHQFKCRGLTYWFDENRNTAFCLIEAPNETAIVNMHKKAHGKVPHQVIEVEPSIVESFLGRIEDPEKAKNTQLNIINDPAFRVILLVGLGGSRLENKKTLSLYSSNWNHKKLAVEIADEFEGSVVTQKGDCLLISFKSVSKAVFYALKMQAKFHDSINEKKKGAVGIKISINAGVPVNWEKSIFEDTIKFAERMFHFIHAEVIVSHEIKDLYKSENQNKFIESKGILALTQSDEIFLTRLLDFLEKEWNNTDLRVEDFENYLGFSKSYLYRKMMQLTGKSPNTFLMSYRLNRALEFFNSQKNNVSEIAFASGFNSPSYFSKCFRKKFGILPSEYLNEI